jgi:predicted RNase H-like HicB family nuclease
MAIYYPAIIETDEKGGYGVFFPDLPGCVSAGDTQQQAAENAGEALLLHIEGMLEDKLALPAPSRLQDLTIDADVQEVGRVLVAAGPFRLERVNVSFEGLLLARIDRLASQLGQSRSEFLAQGARRMLESFEGADAAVKPPTRRRRS